MVHINSVRRMQPGFQIATLRTLTSAPSPDGRALCGAEAVASQVLAAVVIGAECHTHWASFPLAEVFRIVLQQCVRPC